MANKKIQVSSNQNLTSDPREYLNLANEAKSFEVVDAEVNSILERYFEENAVPFAWEVKILMDIVSSALHDQFAAHEEDIIGLQEELKSLREEVKQLKGGK